MKVLNITTNNWEDLIANANKPQSENLELVVKQGHLIRRYRGSVAKRLFTYWENKGERIMRKHILREI